MIIAILISLFQGGASAETQVDASVVSHSENAYVLKKRVFLDYLSWQTTASLVGPFEPTSLLSTNVGFAPSFGVSLENKSWAYHGDLSFVYGSGGVSAAQGAVTYQQSNVSAWGGKFAISVGKIVSSKRTELGLKASLLAIKQDLETPAVAGYTIEKQNTVNGILSIYSRWTFDAIYLETEFGRYIAKPATLWALGFGYTL